MEGTWIDIVKQLGVPTAVMTVESLLRHIYDLPPNFNKIAKRNSRDDSDAVDCKPRTISG